MAKEYTAVFRRAAFPSDAKAGTSPRTGSEIVAPGLTSAYVVNVNATTETVAEVQKTIAAGYPGVATDTVRVVVASELKES